MAEPEVALVFTPDLWVEELHRHLTDHGGARVRQIVVEPDVALEEQYDVLVVGHRWPALTHAFVTDVRARGRTVLGVFDREEPSGRAHLVALGVDDVVESDCGPHAFVLATQRLAGRRRDLGTGNVVGARPARHGRIVAVGGPPGVGRTEVAIQLASSLDGVVVDADDLGPSIAPRLGLPVEPNLRTAIDAVEHGRGDLDGCVITDRSGAIRALAGLPSVGAWVHVRPGEVLRIVERLAATADHVVVDGVGVLEDVGTAPRGRFAVARAIAVEADVIVGVCAASPVGVVRFLAWAVALRALAPDTPFVVAVNRAPRAQFGRAELHEELARSLPVRNVVFLAEDRRVTDATWDARTVNPGPFTRGGALLAEQVRNAPTARARQTEDGPRVELAS